MSEWKKYKFSDFAELRKEQIPPNGIEQPYIGLEHIEQQNLRLSGIGSSNEVISNKFKFYSGDVLYGKLRPYFRKVYNPKFGGVCSTDIFVIKNKELVDKTFLFYLVATEDFTSIANSGSSGTRMPRAEWSQLAKSEWFLPNDIEEQSQIASILSSLDDKIELNLQMNQTLEAMAQAIFKEWFVNFNFPGFDGELVDGLPKGWKNMMIKNIGKVVTGNTPSSNNPEYFGNTTPFITPSDFKNYQKLILDAGRYLSDEGRSAMKNRLLPKDCIIVTCIGSDMGKVAFNKVECVTNQQINSIIPNKEVISPDYLYYDLVFKYDLLRNIATGGSTMPIINKSRFELLEVLVPSHDVLLKFQLLIDGLNSKNENNIQQIKFLTQIRDSLLPKLMTGKIQIKE